MSGFLERVSENCKVISEMRVRGGFLRKKKRVWERETTGF